MVWPRPHFPGADVIVEILELWPGFGRLEEPGLDGRTKNIMQTASITVVLFTIASFGIGSAADLGSMGSHVHSAAGRVRMIRLLFDLNRESF